MLPANGHSHDAQQADDDIKQGCHGMKGKTTKVVELHICLQHCLGYMQRHVVRC
jgi:hypothetical protein